MAKGGRKKTKPGQKEGVKQGAGNKTRPCDSTEHKGSFLKRKVKCRLFDHKCTKCGILEHSEKYCHGQVSQGTAAATEEVMSPVSD